MKIKYYCPAVLLSFSLLINNKVYSQQSVTEKFLLQLHEKKFRWMVEKKLDSLGSILDDRLLYVHSNGWTETAKEVIDDLRSGELIMNSVKVNEAGARVYKNNTAIITGKGLFNVVVNGRDVELNLYYTEVYIKKKNNWMLVTRHDCKL